MQTSEIKLCLFTILVFLTLSSREIDAQKIVFDEITRLTPCSKYLRSDYDSYRITGIYGPTFIPFTKKGWKPTVKIQVLKEAATHFTDICTISIGESGEFCSPFTTQSCYCDHIDATDGSAHIVLSATADVSYSHGIIRGEWANSNGTFLYSDSNLTLSHIFDVHASVLVLNVNGVQAVENSTSCGGSLIPQKTNILELCCTKSALPCYPRISLNGIVVAENRSLCATYTMRSVDKKYVGNITKASSACTMDSYIPISICTINTYVENADTTTASSTSDKFTVAISTTNLERTITTAINMDTTKRSIHRSQQKFNDEDLLVTYIALNVIALFLYSILRWVNTDNKPISRSRKVKENNSNN